MVKGAGLAADQSGAQLLEWRMTVRPRPWPLWVWLVIAAVLLAIAAFAARHFLKPPVFTDLKLEVLEPNRQTIDLAGRQSVKLGAGGEFVPDSTTAFSITAKKASGAERARLDLQNGQMTLKKQGVKQPEQVLGDEEIFDGDILQFEEHRIRVASFSLVRE